MRLRHVLFCLLLFASGYSSSALAADISPTQEQSFHLGLFHPNGVDFAGYSVEKELGSNIYSFYNFGFPSLAATGFSYYENRNGNGITATAGIGIGFVMYGSAAYQFKIDYNQYIRIGAGLGVGIAYGGFVSVISYEHRFKE